jgi:hypothetical protein
MIARLAKFAQQIKREVLLLLRTRFTRDILISDYIQRNMLDNPKYQHPLRLNRYEQQVFSQNGEDGILAEIFRRIGVASKYFVEFGVGDGTENNTAALIFQDWVGTWLEGDRANVQSIQNSYRRTLANAQLKVFQSFLTQENICDLFSQAEVPHEFDLLSIDIDGNDYYLWRKILLGGYRPRVVVIEYNAIYSADIHWVVPYRADTRWDLTSWTGSSLRALFELGQEMGYELVGCNFSGLNAFFVRRDLVGDQFLIGESCALHYEPARYFLHTRWGHRRRVDR